MMTVDIHTHVIVPGIIRDAAPEEAWRPRLFWEGGRQVVEVDGRRTTAVPREFVAIERILESQDAAGVDRVVVSPWVSLLRYEASAEEGLRASRIYNEGLAGLAAARPDRVGALGTVPLQAPDLAAREIADLMTWPGLRGVEVAASVRGVYLGDDRFRPFWDAAEASGALVFIHPTTRGFDLPVFSEYFLWNTVGNPMETTVTAAHMVMAGVMEAHPRLKVVLAHGGGAILALRGRLEHARRVNPQAGARLSEPVAVSLRRFHFDTVTHDLEVLRELIACAGADHVLMGSDYPFDMSVGQPASMVRALGLAPDDEAKVLGGNAARLLGYPWSDTQVSRNNSQEVTADSGR